MPRVAGQIDLAKSEAILDAAVEVFAERGQLAGVEDIARRACVSKQTIYNHYGSKAELVRAIVTRRVSEIALPLSLPGAVEDPERALTAFGVTVLSGLGAAAFKALLRLAVVWAAEMPEVGAALYESGVKASRRRLAEFLQLEHDAGRLDIPDPYDAAELFMGMLVGPYQLPTLLGVDEGPSPERIEAAAREVAARFLKAFAPN